MNHGQYTFMCVYVKKERDRSMRKAANHYTSEAGC
jgi:hypothetical protein